MFEKVGVKVNVSKHEVAHRFCNGHEIYQLSSSPVLYPPSSFLTVCQGNTVV